jgi:uncharacterized RDD family membrane protein YckC
MNENLEQSDNLFIKSEEMEERKDKIDYSKSYRLPSIKTRYFSTLIDLMVILGISLSISSIFEKIGEVPNYLRIVAFIVVFILYEPLLISFGATLGQLILSIRVKSFKDPLKKLPIHLALIRTAIKVLLGWLSFITITFNMNRRAIHDFISNSIMIETKKAV